MAENNKEALSGTALSNFIEDSYEHIFSGNQLDNADVVISQEERMAALSELLSQQIFAPQNITELDLVHSAWSIAGNPVQALSFLEEHKISVLENTPESQFNFFSVLYLLNTAYSEQELKLDQALERLVIVTPLLIDLNVDELKVVFNLWLDLIEKCQAYNIAEPYVEVIYKNIYLGHGNKFFTEIVHLVKKSDWENKKNNTKKAAEYIEQASTLLADLKCDEKRADFWDWVYLIEQALEHVPQCVLSVVNHCFQHLKQTGKLGSSLAIQRYRNIYTGRLVALSFAKQGKLEQAIEVGRDCCLYIDIDDKDNIVDDLRFLVEWMTWLEKTQRFEELASFALSSTFHCRIEAMQTGYEMALRYVNMDTPQKECWALILSWVAMSEEAQEYIKPPPESAAYYLSLVASNSPYQPFIALMRGMTASILDREGKSQALELLEYGVKKFPEFANNEVLIRLWGLRFHIYGMEALEMPYPVCPGGTWSYNLGSVFNNIQRHKEVFLESVENLTKLPDQEYLNDLARYYFESGLKCYEQFWNTATGNYPDAYVHCYSMLCNNYGILLRDSYHEYERAIELHKKGLAASPFSEHMLGLLLCYISKKDSLAIAHYAEELWHFVLENGFQRHDPRIYLEDVIAALVTLERTNEIALWVERLEQWWQASIEGEEIDLNDLGDVKDYYYCLIPMLEKLAHAGFDTALSLLRKCYVGASNMKETDLLRYLGYIFRELEVYEDAYSCYEEAIMHINESTESYDIEHAHQGLQLCKDALLQLEKAGNAVAAIKKPWWKIW